MSGAVALRMRDRDSAHDCVDVVTEHGSRRMVHVALVLSVIAGGVLRAVHLRGTALIWDEALDGVVSRMSFGHMLSFLRADDVHPPLEYILRTPIARHTTEEWLLRLPSAVASTAVLAVLGVWLRSRGRLALVAVAAAAVGSFQLYFAWMARPYAAMVLVGVTAAYLSDRWLRTSSPRIAVAVAVVLFLGTLIHESGLILAPGVFAIAGLRRDRAAWEWRTSVTSALALWAVVWGPTFIHQLSSTDRFVGYIKFTSARTVVEALHDLVTVLPGAAALTATAVVVAGLALRWVDRVLWRVWVCLFVVPVAAAAITGLRYQLFWSKTIAVTSWAVFLGVAAAIEVVARRWSLGGALVASAAVLLIVPGTTWVLDNPQGGYPPPWADSVTHLQHSVTRGDVVMTDDATAPPALWYLGTRSSVLGPPFRTGRSLTVIADSGVATGQVWRWAGNDPRLTAERESAVPDG
jgi:hypothetical protein